MKSFLVLLVVLVVGGVIYVETRNTLIPQGAEQPPVEAPVVSSQGKKISFAAFAARGEGSYKCTVSQYLNNADNTGTVYLDGVRVKGSFLTTTNGEFVENSFLLRDGMSYTWSSVSPTQGVKMPVSSEQEQTNNIPGTYGWNTEQIGDYTCEPWNVQEAMFVVPTIITFKVIS